VIRARASRACWCPPASRPGWSMTSGWRCRSFSCRSTDITASPARGRIGLVWESREIGSGAAQGSEHHEPDRSLAAAVDCDGYTDFQLAGRKKMNGAKKWRAERRRETENFGETARSDIGGGFSASPQFPRCAPSTGHACSTMQRASECECVGEHASRVLLDETRDTFGVFWPP